MITVTRDEQGISITGHSGLAPPGQDIVCSAVSTLAQTLHAGIEALTDDAVSGHFEPGCARIEVGHPSRQTQLLMDAFLIGVNGVAAAYPDYVTVQNDGCGGATGHAVGIE